VTVVAAASGRDPVTGVFRPLKSDEYRYKRPWNGVLWWTIGNVNYPVPDEYRGTLSNPMGTTIPSKSGESDPVTDGGMPPVTMRDRFAPFLNHVPDSVQAKAPLIGGVAVVVTLVSALVYKYRSRLKRGIRSGFGKLRSRTGR
jgi:hypothetical protein